MDTWNISKSLVRNIKHLNCLETLEQFIQEEQVPTAIEMGMKGAKRVFNLC